MPSWALRYRSLTVALHFDGRVLPSETGPTDLRRQTDGCEDHRMPVQDLVGRFYGELWNEADLGIAGEILHPDISFRGSVGQYARGPREVCQYVAMVTSALAGYHCQVIELVAEGDRAAAKVRFSGLHTADFLGYPPTGQLVEWVGAAFFTAEHGLLREVWVLADLAGLRDQLHPGP